MINLVLHNRTRVRIYGESFFRRICDATAPYLPAGKAGLGAPKGHFIEIGLSLVGQSAIRKLNRTYRHKDTSTDVLSFPLHMKPIPGYTAISLGDLFISPRDVVAKAAFTGQSVRKQMQWTVIHGLLHLAGYDHQRGVVAARKMFALERSILKKLTTDH